MSSAFLAAFGGLHYGFYTKNLLMDTPIYERYGDAIVHAKQVPYRDFAVEYPPGALPVFVAPSIAAEPGDFGRYARLFEALMLLCGAAAAALVGYILTLQRARPWRLVAGTLVAGLAPLALGPVVLSRFDLWPAALTIGALAALAADRRRLGFLLLGGAIAAKVYPVVLLPLALAYVWRREGRREAGVGVGIVAGVIAVCLVPFALLAPHGVWESFSGQASRPLQIESLGASLLLAAHHLWGLSLTQISSHGSDNLAGGLPEALAVFQTLLAPALLLAIWTAFVRGEPDRDRLIRYSAGAVCAFIAFGKVLSPQFLVWLIALVPLVTGRRGVAAAALFVCSLVLTQLWFPSQYIDLVYELEPRASWFVVARDLVLVALFVTLVWPERRARSIGVSAVAIPVVMALAAIGAAAASSPAQGGPAHSGLLDETGVASSCAERKAVPSTTAGIVHYDTSAFTNTPARDPCIRVSLRADAHVQLFSAAYRGGFDPANPQAHYLGDTGVCTNIEGATGRERSYAFRVSAGARFVVEVEECSPSRALPAYRLRITTPNAPVVRSAAATRIGSGVVIRWRANPASPTSGFAVFRERDGVKVRLNSRPIRVGRYVDRALSSIRSRYWIRATGPDGSWSWYGPILV